MHQSFGTAETKSDGRPSFVINHHTATVQFAIIPCETTLPRPTARPKP